MQLIDGGTSGVALQSQIMNKDLLIIIDALSISDTPGTVHVLKGDSLLSQSSDIKLSPHQISFFDLLQFMALQKIAPKEIVVIGIVPKDIGCGTNLSKPVENCLEIAANEIIAHLMQTGIDVYKRTEKIFPDYWWKPN